jgi:hypothetical protein
LYSCVYFVSIGAEIAPHALIGDVLNSVIYKGFLCRFFFVVVNVVPNAHEKLLAVPLGSNSAGSF